MTTLITAAKEIKDIGVQPKFLAFLKTKNEENKQPSIQLSFFLFFFCLFLCHFHSAWFLIKISLKLTF